MIEVTGFGRAAAAADARQRVAVTVRISGAHRAQDVLTITGIPTNVDAVIGRFCVGGWHVGPDSIWQTLADADGFVTVAIQNADRAEVAFL
jgi:hypothetical protein